MGWISPPLFFRWMESRHKQTPTFCRFALPILAKVCWTAKRLLNCPASLRKRAWDPGKCLLQVYQESLFLELPAWRCSKVKRCLVSSSACKDRLVCEWMQVIEESLHFLINLKFDLLPCIDTVLDWLPPPQTLKTPVSLRLQQICRTERLLSHAQNIISIWIKKTTKYTFKCLSPCTSTVQHTFSFAL